MRIETERLAIRSLRMEDEKTFIEMASDGSLTDIFGDCRECCLWMGDWIAESIKLEKENDPARAYLAYAVEHRRSRKVIGSVGCSYYEDLEQIGITYFLGAAHRGHGYMAEAVRAYVRFFFQSYDFPVLIATSNASNKASCRTLEKAGFCLRETKPYRDMFDEAEEMCSFYELRAEDWQA